MGLFQPDFEPFHDNEHIAEICMLMGAMVSYMTYAFTTLAFILCLRALLKRHKTSSRSILMTYICLQFGCISAYMVVNTMGKIEAFTTHRDFPGGPVGWLETGSNGVLCIAGNVCIAFSIWLADGFLLYRAVILQTTQQWFLIVPLGLYIASLVVGGLRLANHVNLASSAVEMSSFAVPWFICACVSNLSIVLTIAIRLLWYRHLVRRGVGPHQRHHGELYERVLVILVESAALYAAFMIAYIVSYVLQSSAARVLQATLSNIRGIASYLIILRLMNQTLDANMSCMDSGAGFTMTEGITGYTTECGTGITMAVAPDFSISDSSHRPILSTK